MKKFYLVLVLVITVLMVNFTIWFWQTKTITNSINELKVQLASQNIKIDFTEIKFSTFKCWQVNGSLEKFSVFFGNSYNRPGIEIPTLKFYTRPFEKAITLESNDNILFHINTLYSNKTYKVQYPNNDVSKITIELDVSFSDFLDMLHDQNRSPLYTTINHLQWVNPEFNLIDDKNNVQYLSAKSALLDVKSSKSELSKDFEFNTIVNDIQYNVNYSTDNLFEKLEQELNSRLGKINFIFQFHFKKHPDHEQLKLIHQDKKNDFRPVMSAYTVYLKNLTLNTSLFNINLNGSIEKQPNFIFPQAHLIMNFVEYLTILDFFIDTFNVRLEQLSIPLFKINDVQKEKIKLLLNSFNPENNKLSLELESSDATGVTISKRPLLRIISDFDHLFKGVTPSSGLPSNTYGTNLEPKNNMPVILNNDTGSTGN